MSRLPGTLLGCPRLSYNNLVAKAAGLLPVLEVYGNNTQFTFWKNCQRKRNMFYDLDINISVFLV